MIKPTSIESMMFAVLHVPIFISASQCLWEMMNPAEERDKRRPQLRVSVFSAGFVACAGVCFLLLLGDRLPLSLAHRQLAAGLFLLLGLAAWERCRISRLKSGVSLDSLTLPQSLLRIGLAVLAGVLFMFISVGLLPTLADKLAEVSPKLKLPGLKSGENPNKSRPKPRDASVGGEGSGGSGSGNGSKSNPATRLPKADDGGENLLPGATSATDGRAELPGRGNYNPPDKLHVALQFRDFLEGQKLAEQDLLYVRTVAMSRFRDNTWVPGQADGWWLKDADDSLPDGKVQISNGPAEGAAYTVFLLDADGTHLPHLAGAEQFSLSKVYVLPDDWFQIEPYGPLKVDGVSTPKLFQLLDEDSLRVGGNTSKPMAAHYFEGADEAQKTQLIPLAKEIFGVKKLPSDKIRSLADWLSKNIAYSTQIQNQRNLAPLMNFLFDEKKGFCEHYATAGCILLRMAGLPARMVYGYQGGVYNEQERTYLFGSADSHAWVEVHFDSVGWVICDFTPPQDRSVNAEELLAGGSDGIQVNLGSFEAAERVVDQVDAAKIKTPDLSLLERLQGLAIANGSHFAILAGLCLLGAVIWHFWKNKITAEDDATTKAAKKAAELMKQPAYFEAFTKMCQEFGHAYTPDLTLREFEQRLKTQQFYHDEFGQMTAYHYATRYEDARPDTSQEGFWVDFIKNFARERKQLAKLS